MQRFNLSISHNSFLRSVLVLVGGTGIAHAVTALAMPVLTRLYTPSDFSLLAVFSSVLSIVTVVSCLRFDIAIAIPKRYSEAFRLMLLALGCAVMTSVIAAIVIALFPTWLPEITKRPELQPYMWLLPLGLLLSGAYSALQTWFIREKKFSMIAQSRIAQSVASAGTQIGTAGFSAAPSGLIIGYLLNTGSACLIFGVRLFREKRCLRNVKRLSCLHLLRTWRCYDRFPKYSTWESLANSAAIQLPIILIAASVTGPEAGYILLAMSVIQAPMSLLGSAIGQVYLSRAPNEYREGRLDSFTEDIIGGAIKAGVGPLLAVGVLSPTLFEIIFGEDWNRSGWLVAWMTPWFIMQFLVSPVSMAIHVTGHQRTALVLQVLGLILRVFFVLAATKVTNEPVGEAYALSGAFFYFLYLCVLVRCTECSWKSIFIKASSSVGVIILWLSAALLLLIIWLNLASCLIQ